MKHRFRNLAGLTVAALAILVIGAQAASATQPKFEVESGHAFPVEFSGTSGPGELVSTLFGFPAEVHCESGTSKGELSGPTSAANVSVTYKKCTSILGECHNAAAGEIVTKQLKGETVYFEESGQKAGILLTPASGTSFANFTCGSSAEEVTGSVVGQAAPENGAFSTAGTLTFRRSGTNQVPLHYLAPATCASTEATLKDNGNRAALQTEEHLTFVSKVKLVSTKC